MTNHVVSILRILSLATTITAISACNTYGESRVLGSDGVSNGMPPREGAPKATVVTLDLDNLQEQLLTDLFDSIQVPDIGSPFDGTSQRSVRIKLRMIPNHGLRGTIENHSEEPIELQSSQLELITNLLDTHHVPQNSTVDPEESEETRSFFLFLETRKPTETMVDGSQLWKIKYFLRTSEHNTTTPSNDDEVFEFTSAEIGALKNIFDRTKVSSHVGGDVAKRTAIFLHISAHSPNGVSIDRWTIEFDETSEPLTSTEAKVISTIFTRAKVPTTSQVHFSKQRAQVSETHFSSPNGGVTRWSLTRL